MRSRRRNYCAGALATALATALILVAGSLSAEEPLFPGDLPTRTDLPLTSLQTPTAVSGLKGHSLSVGAGMLSQGAGKDPATSMDIDLATELFLGWAMGFSMEMRSLFDEAGAERGDRTIDSAEDYSWEYGLGFGRRMGGTEIGLTWRTFDEKRGRTRIDTFDLALGQSIGETLRFYAGFRDLSARDGDSFSYDLGLGLRPGTSRVGLHSLVSFGDEGKAERVRGVLRLGILQGLDLDLGGELRDPEGAKEWLFAARLGISLDPAGQYEAGWSGLKDSPGDSWQMAFRARLAGGSKASLLPQPPTAIMWNLADALQEAPTAGFMGARTKSFVESMSQLEQLLERDDLRVLVLNIPSMGLGWGQAADVRGLIERYRNENRAVVALLRAPAGPAVYLASAADYVYVDREGGITFTGLYRPMRFFGPAMDMLGVQVQYIRHAEYKSFPERFDQQEPSPESLEQEKRILDVFEEEILRALQERLDGEIATPRDFVDKAPYTAQQAVEVGFADAAIDIRDVEEQVRGDLNMPGLRFRDLMSRKPQTATGWGRPKQVALVVVDGDIVAGRGARYPALGIANSGEEDVIAAIEEAHEGPYDAIFVRLVTPGGDALASTMISRTLAKAAEDKPVIISMGNVAASGGYDIACAAQLPVFAAPLTITGSVGIFALKPVVKTLTDRLGLPVTELSRGKRAGIFSTHRPWTAEEEKVLSDKLQHYYLRFVERVADARGISIAEAEPLCRGRVWAGTDALKHGLVDGTGGVVEALDRLKSELDISSLNRVRFVLLPRAKGLFAALSGDGLSLGNREVEMMFERMSGWIGTRELLRLAMQPAGTVMARLPGAVSPTAQ